MITRLLISIALCYFSSEAREFRMRTSCMYYTLTQQLQQLQPKFPNLFCTERIPASYPPVSTPRALSPPPPQLRLPAPVPARLPGPPSPRLTRPPTPRPPKPRPPWPPRPPPPLRKPASASPPSPPRPPKPRPPRPPRPPLLPRTPPSTKLPPYPPPPQTTSVTLLVTSGNEPDELLSCFTLDAYGMPYVIGILNDLLEVIDISKDLAIQVLLGPHSTAGSHYAIHAWLPMVLGPSGLGATISPSLRSCCFLEYPALSQISHPPPPPNGTAFL